LEIGLVGTGHELTVKFVRENSAEEIEGREEALSIYDVYVRKFHSKYRDIVVGVIENMHQTGMLSNENYRKIIEKDQSKDKIDRGHWKYSHEPNYGFSDSTGHWMMEKRWEKVGCPNRKILFFFDFIRKIRFFYI